jgi:molybdenum-dependent DNA-binding transcriptional regulator ModE
MARRKASSRLECGLKRNSRNAERYNCVQKIVQDGCPKKSSAVSEAAKALKCSERSIWTSLEEHERELKRQAEEARRIRIALGEEEPTDEEIEDAGGQWLSLLADLRKGK